MTEVQKFCTFPETMSILNVTVIEIWRLIRKKTLIRKGVGSAALIGWLSIHQYICQRCRRAPKGYFTLKQIMKMFKIKRAIVEGALDRGELDAKKFNRGIIIEKHSALRWGKFLKECRLIEICNRKSPKSQINTKLKVKNILGIHLRPSGDICEVALIYLPSTTLKLTTGGSTVCGDGLLGVAGLGAAYNDWLSIEISGPYAEHLLFDLKCAFSRFCEYEKERKPNRQYNLASTKRDFEIYH